MSQQMLSALAWAAYLGVVSAGTAFFTALSQGRTLRDSGVAAGLGLFTSLGGGAVVGIVNDRRAQATAAKSAA